MTPFKTFIEEANTNGTYSAYHLTDHSAQQLMTFVKELGIPNPVLPNDYHITTMYSRAPVDYTPDVGRNIVVEPVSYQVFNTQKSKSCLLVLRVESPELHKRFAESQKLGATYDFDDYLPHITLTGILPEAPDVSKYPLPTFPIVLADEFVTDLKD